MDEIENQTYSLLQLQTWGGHPDSDISPYAYDHAITNAQVWLDQHSEDLGELISENLSCDLSMNEEFADATLLGWGSNPLNVDFKCDCSVIGFMARHKIAGKYRALWYSLHNLGCFDRWLHIDTTRNRDQDHPLERWEADLDRYTDLEDTDQHRYDLIITQLRAVGALIQDQVWALSSQLTGQIQAEERYRYSMDFIKEEAAAMELQFDDAGTLIN